jgi:hypothetical protein
MPKVKTVAMFSLDVLSLDSCSLPPNSYDCPIFSILKCSNSDSDVTPAWYEMLRSAAVSDV